MAFKEFGTELILTAESVDICSEKVTEYLESLGTERKEIYRLRLSIETILLKWQEVFGQSESFKLSCYSYLGQPTIQLKLKEKPFDPLTEEEQDSGEWSRKLLAGLQTTPMYSYSKNTNVVTFKLVRKHISPIVMLGYSIAASIVVSLLGIFIPEGIRVSVAENILAPICDTYINTMGFFGIPLIFLSVVLGVCGIGDAPAFGRIGKKMIGHFLKSLFAVTAICLVIAYPFFGFSHGQGALSFSFRDFLGMIMSFVPTNLLSPFIECNAMQLIFMGVAFGIAILKLAPELSGLSKVFEDLNSILLLISQWITRLIPFFVFAIIIRTVWPGNLSQLLGAWKPWVITILLQLAVLAFLMLQISLHNHVSFRLILKKVWGTFLIAFGTNSCGATIGEIYDASGKLGVSPRVLGFGVPIGTSVFKPCSAIRIILVSYFLASTYQVNVSVQWFLVVGIMAFLLSIAVPAIPGGVMLFYGMLFAQIGVPAEAITLMLAVDFLFDAPCTAFNQIAAELALVQQSEILELLDKEKLRKPL